MLLLTLSPDEQMTRADRGMWIVGSLVPADPVFSRLQVLLLIYNLEVKMYSKIHLY